MPRAFAGRIPPSRFSPSFLLFLVLASGLSSGQVTDLRGQPKYPLSDHEKIHVLLFVRTDCPITNRYAPELGRIAGQFSPSGVDFWLVYSAAAETAPVVAEHIRQYHFPGTALLDPRHELAQDAHATVAPEAAVFDRSGRLQYLGRIDDRWISFGKSRPQPTVHDLNAAITAVLAGKTPPEQRTGAIGCSLEDVR